MMDLKLRNINRCSSMLCRPLHGIIGWINRIGYHHLLKDELINIETRFIDECQHNCFA